jgi:hypothetical protein
LSTNDKHWPSTAANGIAATTINRCCTVNNDDHLAVVVVNCAVALDGSGINDGR